MVITIRDDFMSLLQEEMALMDGPVCVVMCMDGRLTDMVADLNTRGGEIIRSPLGGVFGISREDIQSGEYNRAFMDALKKFKNFMVLSHDTCGAAQAVEDAEAGKIKLPDPIYRELVEPFAECGCATHDEIEMRCPEIQAQHIQELSQLMGYGIKNVDTMRLKTPHYEPEPNQQRDLVITTPLVTSYSKLPRNGHHTYFIHDDPNVVGIGAWAAVEKLGIRDIRFVAQNPREEEVMAKLSESFRQRDFVASAKVVVHDPIVIHTPPKFDIRAPAQRTPARDQGARDRAKM